MRPRARGTAEDVIAWSRRFDLIRPVRIPGMLRLCREIDRHVPGTFFDASRLCLLICALDDLLDAPAPPSHARQDAIVADLIAALDGRRISDYSGPPASWPPLRDELVRLCAEEAPRPGAPRFSRELRQMLEAMCQEQTWRAARRPDLTTYLSVGTRSVAAPAVWSWVASRAGLVLEGCGACEELLTQAGLVVRLANDLADTGREAREGKVNAVRLLCEDTGLDEGEARAQLTARLGTHMDRVAQLGSQIAGLLQPWSRAVVASTEHVEHAYRSAGDLLNAS
jgi:hypothetical protein